MAEDGQPPLSSAEVLELLALSEVVIRKAGYGRQTMVRSARAAGASWTQIGAALGSSKQAAWEAHNRWIEDQARQHERTGYEGLDPAQVEAARDLAGGPDCHQSPTAAAAARIAAVLRPGARIQPAAARSPACSSASRLWQAVTPDPQ